MAKDSKDSKGNAIDLGDYVDGNYVSNGIGRVVQLIVSRGGVTLTVAHITIGEKVSIRKVAKVDPSQCTLVMKADGTKV